MGPVLGLLLLIDNLDNKVKVRCLSSLRYECNLHNINVCVCILSYTLCIMVWTDSVGTSLHSRLQYISSNYKGFNFLTFPKNICRTV